MSRRASQSPTELVVTYFMTGDLVAVEQALVMARAIITNRRASETSVALGAPTRRRRRSTPADVAPEQPTAAPSGAGAAAPTPVIGAIQQQAAAQSPRRRTRPVIVPPSGTEAPKRRRRRRAAVPAAPVAGEAVPVHAASALPSQLAPGEDGYEPISTQE